MKTFIGAAVMDDKTQEAIERVLNKMGLPFDTLFTAENGMFVNSDGKYLIADDVDEETFTVLLHELGYDIHLPNFIGQLSVYFPEEYITCIDLCNNKNA